MALILSGVATQTLSAQGLSGISQRLEEKVAVSFSRSVANILNSRCGACHVRGSKGDFKMSNFAELMRARGVVTPGNPAQSSLYSMVESGDMPPKGSMPQQEKDVIKRWIEQGAKFDGTSENDSLASLASAEGGAGRAAGGGQASGGGSPGYGSAPGYGSTSSGSGGAAPGYGSAPGYGGTSSGSGGQSSGSGAPPGYGSAPGYGATSSGGQSSGSGAPPGYGSAPGYGATSSGSPSTPPGGAPQTPGGAQAPGGAQSRGGGQSRGGAPGYQNSEDGSGEEEDMYMEEEEDMYMEEDMGGGYGRPSAGRSGSGTAKGDAMDTYGSSLTSLLGSLDLSGLFFPVQEINVESGPVLAREAEQAFLAGDQPVALELMFGHMATEYSDASFSLQSVKYSPLLRRPIWNIRWGVSMFVRGDEVSDRKPIREGATPLGRVASSGGGRRGARSPASQGEDYGEEMEMEDYGDASSGEMEMEMEMGDYGDDTYDSQMAGRNRPQRSEAPQIPERKMLSEEVQESLDKTLGLVATVVSEEFNKRFQRGDFGPLFTSVTPAPVVEQAAGNARQAAPVVAPTARMSVALNEALLEAGDPTHPMWQPGLVFLGEGTSDEMLAVAQRANVDLIFHFDIILKAGRNEAVQNISRCRLLHVSPPADSQGRTRNLVVTSKGMDSYEAQQFAGAGRMDEREYVTEQLSNLFEIIDRDVKVIDLPPLAPERAKERVASIISGAEARSLRTLAEVRLFQARNLISEAEAEAAFDIVGGADGLLMMHGPPQQRTETARRWAIQSSIDANSR